MTQTKLFKLLQKTITTLMCFWLLSTQMPINVVFADEINTEEELFEEETSNTTDSSDEHSSNISLNANEKDDLNPGVFTKTMNITTGGYLLIVAIILFILIGIVLIIRKKKKRNK